MRQIAQSAGREARGRQARGAGATAEGRNRTTGLRDYGTTDYGTWGQSKRQKAESGDLKSDMRLNMNVTTKSTKATKALRGLPAIPAPPKSGRRGEIKEVEAFIRSVGGRPMSRSTKQRLAKAGCSVPSRD